MASKQNKDKLEFSKSLLVQESILIWILTISFILLAFYCVQCGYIGSLPWLTAMVGLPWTAYGVSQGFYYTKSLKENTKNGIKYETVLKNLEYDQQQNSALDWTIQNNEDMSGLGLSNNNYSTSINTNTSNNNIDIWYGI